MNDLASMPAETYGVRLRRFFAVLSAGRWWFIVLTLITTGIAVALVHVLPKKYEATVLFLPESSSGGGGGLGALSSVASELGGLASLAGLALPSDSKKAESMAVLQSEALTESYIEKNNLLPILYAKQWDAVQQRWKVTDATKTPTVWKANRLFKGGVRNVSTDSKTGVATMTITWTDPVLAAKWANDLVRMTNDYLRDQAIQQSERNISYLEDQALKTDQVGVKQAIYTLLQSEINKVMLARGSNEYALRVLDPAVVPEQRSSPKLSVLGPIGFLSGIMLALAIVLTRDAWRRAAAPQSQGQR